MNIQRTATIALLALLCMLQLLCLWRAPAVYAPAMVTVTLRPGQAITLGRDELAAPQAAPGHVGLRRDAAGRWLVRNLGAGRQLLLQRDGKDRRMGSTALRQGQVLRIGGATFNVGAADGRAFAFTGAGHEWRYDGATLLRDGAAQPPCPGATVGARALALWNRVAPHPLTGARPLSFGGNLHCGNRLAIAYLPGGSAIAARGAAALLLSNAAGSESHAPVLVDGAELAQR